MKKLPGLKDLNLKGKKVLLRTNYDVPLAYGQAIDSTRIEESLPTIRYLLRQKAKLIILTHLDRPGGKIVPNLGLKPVAACLQKLSGQSVNLVSRPEQVEKALGKGGLILLQNLRFFPGEAANDNDFAQELAQLGEIYINEAFACSHRKHASIVSLPRFLPAAFGWDCLQEIETLSQLRLNPARPVVLLLGGEKKDKVEAGRKLMGWADWVLLGGKLTEYKEVASFLKKQKIIGDLVKSGQDITPQTTEKFVKIIKKAKTIVWSGPMGNFYQEKYAAGTKKVAQAVVESRAYTVIGGGDTEAALSSWGWEGKIDFVSSGGGAMLEFLVAGTLPGIEAIKRKK